MERCYLRDEALQKSLSDCNYQNVAGAILAGRCGFLDVSKLEKKFNHKLLDHICLRDAALQKIFKTCIDHDRPDIF